MAIDVAPDLRSIPGFGDEDLLYNEGGRISPEQKSEVTHHILTQFAWMILLASFTLPFLSQFWVIAVAILAVEAFWMLRLARLAWEVAGDAIEVVEGSAYPEVVDSENFQDRYYLVVSGKTLGTTQRVCDKLPAGGPYRVYYVRRSGRVLSARPLAGWRPRSASASAHVESNAGPDYDSDPSGREARAVPGGAS